MATPAWLAATVGQPAKAGQINQSLGAHAVTYLYQGVLQSSQTTAGSGSGTTSGGTYLAQKFTTGASQTELGYVAIDVLGGTSGFPVGFSIYASSSGAPNGSPLITVNASQEYIAFAPQYVVFPVPLAVTASTVYFIVAAPPASGTVTWQKSNQTSGAYTSTNGTTWTSQTYGLTYEIYDQTATGPLTCTWEDAGARWTWLQTTGAKFTELSEYTTAQNSGYLQSDRTLSYSGSTLIGVA